MSASLRIAKVAAVLTCVSCIRQVGAWAAGKISPADLPKHAIEQSQITVPGARPFHLRAKVVEATNPNNDGYNAEIEEYWVAPDKWKRTIKAANFSQTVIVNGQKTAEQSVGDYYPNWLHTLVSAIFDPGAALEGVDLSKSSDNPMIGGAKFCRRFADRAGIPPVGNNVFSTFCFENDLLESIGVPGYHAGYKDYRKFAGKQVARKIREYIEPGTEVEASIQELSELINPEEALFDIQQPTGQLETIKVSETALHELFADTPAIVWPAIHGGKVAGVLSIYVCFDRDGRVRETYALNSDHPEMSDAAQKQLQSWRFKPATHNGAHVQVESILTFAYQTKIAP